MKPKNGLNLEPKRIIENVTAENMTCEEAFMTA